MCLLLLSEVGTSLAVPGRAFLDLGHKGYHGVVEGSVPTVESVDCFETHLDRYLHEDIELEPRSW